MWDISRGFGAGFGEINDSEIGANNILHACVALFLKRHIEVAELHISSAASIYNIRSALLISYRWKYTLGKKKRNVLKDKFGMVGKCRLMNC